MIKYKNLIVKRLTKAAWQDYILPIGYTADSFYDVQIESLGKDFCISLKRTALSVPAVHTPEEHGFPDRLFAPHWVNARAYGAFDGDRLAGAIEFCPESWTNRLRVTELWTDEQYRRMGLGTTLMNIAKKYATIHKMRMVILETQSCNINAIDFYFSQGFTLAGVLPYDYSNGDISAREVRLELGWFCGKN